MLHIKLGACLVGISITAAIIGIHDSGGGPQMRILASRDDFMRLANGSAPRVAPKMVLRVPKYEYEHCCEGGELIVMRERWGGALRVFNTTSRAISIIAPHPHDAICAPVRHFIHNRMLMSVCKYAGGGTFVRNGDAYVAIEDHSTIANCAAMDSEGADAVYCQTRDDVRKFNFTTMRDDYVLRPAHGGNCSDVTEFMFARVAPNVVWLMGGVCGGTDWQINGVTICTDGDCAGMPALQMPLAVGGGAAVAFRGMIYVTGGYSPSGGTTLISRRWFAYDLHSHSYTDVYSLGGQTAYHRAVIVDGTPCVVGGYGGCEIEKISIGHLGPHQTRHHALLCSVPEVEVDYIGML